MPPFIHPQAIVQPGAMIGEGTRVWAFAHVLGNAKIGADCNICDHTFIENDVVLGNRVTVKCGVYLWDGIEIQDDVFIGPNATFANDKLPRSKRHPEQFARIYIGAGASIGANATILPGLRIGADSVVKAGSVSQPRSRRMPSWAAIQRTSRDMWRPRASRRSKAAPSSNGRLDDRWRQTLPAAAR